MVTPRVRWGLVWLGAVGASVGVGLIPGDFTGESVCGVWGCFPPVQALASLHTLWLLLLAPPAVLLARRLPGTAAWRVGAILSGFGLLATACVVTTGLTRWGLPASDPEYPAFAVRRAGYSLATHTHLPVIQLVLVGVLMIAARRRPESGREGYPFPESPAGVPDAGGVGSVVTAPRTPPSAGA